LWIDHIFLLMHGFFGVLICAEDFVIYSLTATKMRQKRRKAKISVAIYRVMCYNIFRKKKTHAVCRRQAGEKEDTYDDA